MSAEVYWDCEYEVISGCIAEYFALKVWSSGTRINFKLSQFEHKVLNLST